MKIIQMQQGITGSAALLLFLVSTSSLSWAKEVHKCTINGAVSYQSRPCPNGTADKAFQPQTIRKTQPQVQPRPASNGTTNEIPDTVEGKKRSMAIAQEAYQMTKER